MFLSQNVVYLTLFLVETPAYQQYSKTFPTSLQYAVINIGSCDT